MKLPFLRNRVESSRRVGNGGVNATNGINANVAWQAAGSLAVASLLISTLRPQSSEAAAPEKTEPVVLPDGCNKVDVVLSSGFLSFANHAGFLKACEENGLAVSGIMGTSAGALSGSLYAAGYSPEQVAYELSRLPPADYLQLSNQPWQGGVLNMDKVIERYRELLPATFEELKTDFACGVYTTDGEYRVLDSGPLPEAVVASAAIPFVFEHIPVPGVGPCMDGGKFDRVGLEGWQRRGEHKGRENKAVTLVHLISRSSPFSGKEDVVGKGNIVVLRSPKSGVSLTSLGDFSEHYDQAYQRSNLKLSESVKRV